MKDIDGRIKCGDIEVELRCDSSQLDEALVKMDRLIEKINYAELHGAIPGGMVIASIGAGLVTSQRKFSRRQLFGFLGRDHA